MSLSGLLRRVFAPMLLLCLVCIAHAKPPDVKQLPVKPDGTPYRVALLPVTDITGEKDDQKRNQANAVYREMADQFRQRGFEIMEETVVQKAIADRKLDFTDEEQQRRDNVLQIGKDVKADIVVLVVVTQAYAKLRETTLARHREGLAKTKTWLMDVNMGTPILSAYVWEGKSSGIEGIGLKGNLSRMSAAAGNSIRDVLNETLGKFPRSKNK